MYVDVLCLHLLQALLADQTKLIVKQNCASHAIGDFSKTRQACVGLDECMHERQLMVLSCRVLEGTSWGAPWGEGGGRQARRRHARLPNAQCTICLLRPAWLCRPGGRSLGLSLSC